MDVPTGLRQGIEVQHTPAIVEHRRAHARAKRGPVGLEAGLVGRDKHDDVVALCLLKRCMDGHAVHQRLVEVRVPRAHQNALWAAPSLVLLMETSVNSAASDGTASKAPSASCMENFMVLFRDVFIERRFIPGFTTGGNLLHQQEYGDGDESD